MRTASSSIQRPILIRQLLRYSAVILTLLLLCSSLLPARAAHSRQHFNIGILTLHASHQYQLQGSPWELTLARLNQHPDYQFTAVFLAPDKLTDALQNDELDFIISDAFAYLVLEKNHDILRLLTRTEKFDGEYISSEALSIFTLNNNPEITRIMDLKGKRVALLESEYSTSELFLEKFLNIHDLNIGENVELLVLERTDLALSWLKQGKIDALITKSGLLEKQLDKMTLETLRLVHPRRGWHAPFLHSSVLVPEWAFARAWFINDEIVNQIITLLIGHKKNDHDNYLMEQYHWTFAQKYHGLDQLFALSRAQEVSKFKSESPFSLKLQYWLVFLVICFLLIILIMYLRSSRVLNNRLKASKESLELEIKERQHAQEQALTHQAELAHVARLSTMGEMASGLAHELNQPLSAIHTYVQGCIRLLKMEKNDPEAIINALQLTAQQADRAGGIIRRLRSFVRKGESHKTYTDINHIVNEVTGFLESQLRNKQVNLTLDLDEDHLPPVLADIIQIEQVLINLLKNGIEAMSGNEQATITVVTRRADYKFVELCVIDSGHGISEDKLKRIFNPFFTTKTSGMGMGLSISSSIIEAHDGKLYAENNPVSGARFCFTLPVTEEHLGNNNNE